MRSQTEQGVDPFVTLIMPVYYNKELVTTEELTAVVDSWKMIVGNECAHFNKLKTSGDIKFENCLELFFHTFYHRMWDVHPVSKTLFHGSINRQGAFVARFLSIAIDHIHDEEKWQRLFHHLTEGHNKMGIKAVECKPTIDLLPCSIAYMDVSHSHYSCTRHACAYCTDNIYGEVLMYTIQKCVGPEVFTPTTANGWAKVYSKMLDSIIPVCVDFEKEHKAEALFAHDKRFKEYYERREAVEHRAD